MHEGERETLGLTNTNKMALKVQEENVHIEKTVKCKVGCEVR